MTPEKAIELLHPTTTKEAIRKIEENGGNGIKAVEEACVFACEALEKQSEKILWHKIKMRPATKEEIEYFKENLDYFDDDEQEVFDCVMPENGEEILVATKYGVTMDTCIYDYGYGLEENGEWDGIIAWAYLPKYKEADSNETKRSD